VIDIRKSLVIFAVLFVAASIQSCFGETSVQAGAEAGAQASVQTAVDSQTYLNLTNAALAYYSQDLNYSSKIVDEFTKGSISSSEAMTATTTLYVLALKTYVDLASVSRPSGEAYDTYYSDLDVTFSSYQMYLWLLMKYFETGDRSYATAAAGRISDSYSYFQKAMEDQSALTAQSAVPASTGTAASATATSSAMSVPVNLGTSA